MLHVRSLVLAALVPLAGCTAASAAPSTTQPTSSSMDAALSREKATAAVAAIPASGTDCRVLALTGWPIAVTHIDNPNLQQTAARARFVTYGNGAHDGDRVLDGVVLATIVGKQPSGELLGNHHVAAAEGTLRTKNDVITLTPTSDKCVFNAKAKVLFHDGTGEFAGLSGEGVAEGMLNMCGAPGRANVYARVCKAK